MVGCDAVLYMAFDGRHGGGLGVTVCMDAGLDLFDTGRVRNGCDFPVRLGDDPISKSNAVLRSEDRAGSRGTILTYSD